MPEKKSTPTGLIGLDTSFLIDFFAGNAKAAQTMKEYAKRAYVTDLVIYEFLCGNLTQKEEQLFLSAIQSIPTAPFNTQAAMIASTLHREQKKKGKPIGRQDTMIAASYRAHGIHTIISTNTKHLKQVMNTISY